MLVIREQPDCARGAHLDDASQLTMPTQAPRMTQRNASTKFESRARTPRFRGQRPPERQTRNQRRWPKACTNKKPKTSRKLTASQIRASSAAARRRRGRRSASRPAVAAAIGSVETRAVQYRVGNRHACRSSSHQNRSVPRNTQLKVAGKEPPGRNAPHLASDPSSLSAFALFSLRFRNMAHLTAAEKDRPALMGSRVIANRLGYSLQCRRFGALDLMGDIDELICLGDSIYEYRFSNEVAGIQAARRSVCRQPEVLRAARRPRGRGPGSMPGGLVAQPHRQELRSAASVCCWCIPRPEPRGEYIHRKAPRWHASPRRTPISRCTATPTAGGAPDRPGAGGQSRIGRRHAMPQWRAVDVLCSTPPAKVPTGLCRSAAAKPGHMTERYLRLPAGCRVPPAPSWSMPRNCRFRPQI